MNKIPFILVLQLFFTTAFSQTIDRQLISPAGNTCQDDLICLDWTLGETSNATYYHAGIDFKEGFLQPELWIDNYDENLTLEVSNPDNQVIGSVYPNPFENYFSFTLAQPFEKDIQLRLIDFSGEIKAYKELPAGEYSVRFDLRNYSAGMYVLQIINVEQSSLTTFKVLRQW